MKAESKRSSQTPIGGKLIESEMKNSERSPFLVFEL